MATKETNIIPPLLDSAGSSQDKPPLFQSLPSPDSSHVMASTTTPSTSINVSAGVSPSTVSPPGAQSQAGVPPLIPAPSHPLPGLPPPAAAGIHPPQQLIPNEAPPQLGIPPPPHLMMPSLIPPLPSGAGLPLLSPPPGMGPPLGSNPIRPPGPLLTSPPTTKNTSGPTQTMDSGIDHQVSTDSTAELEDDVDQEVWVQHTTDDGNVYYSDPKSRKTTWEKPENAKIVPFTPPSAPLLPTGGVPPPTGIPFDGPPGPMRPPGLLPGGIPGLPPGIPLIPQRVWSDHKNPDGRTYYYNKVTRQSVWEKPKDLELVMPLPADLANPQMTTPTMSGDNMQQKPDFSVDNPPENAQLFSTDVRHDHRPFPIAMPLNNHPPIVPHIPPSLVSSGQLPPTTINPEKQFVEEPEMDSKELLALVASKLGTGPSTVSMTTKPQGGGSLAKSSEDSKEPKPTCSVPIPGTPWSIVYTSDEKMFFFDATNRKSYWDLPTELENNSQVYKIVENPPWKKKRVGAVEEPASKRIKFDDDEVDEDSTMEVEASISLPRAAGRDKKETSPIAVSREAKMAELRATLLLEERQQSFKAMLLERQVSAFSTWEKELPKFVFDDRFHLLLPKDRKVAFDEFIATRAEQEMKEKKQKMKEKRETFVTLLKESKISKKTTFSEFCRMYGKDERFKAVEKMKERESLFNERILELKKLNRQKEAEMKQLQITKTEKAKLEFVSMLKEATKLTANSEWKKVKGVFQKDSRYQAIDSSSQREQYFEEYIKDLGKDEKEDRVQASLREREREVQQNRTAQQEQWEKERDQLRRTETETTFNAMLMDLIRDPLASWSASRKGLRKDYRWDQCDIIDMEQKEKLFKEHIGALEKKRRVQYRNLLEETTKITLKMPWRKARKLIKDDPRYKKFSDSDQAREDEYEQYLKDKLVQSKNDFKSFLKETKLINHKTKGLIRESDKHLKDIISTLEKDQRYLVLGCIEDERYDILMDYVDDLYRRGPPPPPTATHPTERLRK